MEGVVILQTFEQANATWGWNWILILPIIVIIYCAVNIFFNVMAEKPNKTNLVIFSCIAAVALVITGVVASRATQLPPTYQYQVYMEDNVNMAEFAQRYTIVEQQGITYIVEEKGE